MGHLLVGRSIRKRRNSLTSQVRLGNAEDEMAVPVVKAPGTRHVRLIVEITDDSRIRWWLSRRLGTTMALETNED